MRILGGLAFFFFASVTVASTTAPCSKLLAAEISKVMSVQKAEKEADFSNFIDRDFAKKLKDYYSRASGEDVYASARNTLSNLVADTEELINAPFRKSYLYSLKHFLERGGRFVIDVEMNNFELQSDIVAVRSPAHEFIRVPLYLILYIELGVPNVKENLLRDLTHELRHSITDARTRRKLKESGVNTEPDFIYLHIGAKDVNQSIAYAYMLEDEAVRVQDKFVPQASNNTGDLNLYPELQSLQRLLHTFTYKDLAELESDVAANRQFKILTESFVDHYIHHIEIHSADEVLPPKLEGLMAKLQSKEITSYLAIDLAVKDFDLHAKVIDGRLNEELYDFLRLKIMQVFKKKELRLMRAYRQLQVNALIR